MATAEDIAATALYIGVLIEAHIAVTEAWPFIAAAFTGVERSTAAERCTERVTDATAIPIMRIAVAGTMVVVTTTAVDIIAEEPSIAAVPCTAGTAVRMWLTMVLIVEATSRTVAAVAGDD